MPLTPLSPEQQRAQEVTQRIPALRVTRPGPQDKVLSIHKQYQKKIERLEVRWGGEEGARMPVLRGNRECSC